MNTMKKIISLLLILALCLTMFACGESTQTGGEDKAIASSDSKPFEGNPFGTILAKDEEKIEFNLEYTGPRSDGEAYKISFDEDCEYSGINNYYVLYGGKSSQERTMKNCERPQLVNGMTMVINQEDMQEIYEQGGEHSVRIVAMVPTENRGMVESDPITGEIIEIIDQRQISGKGYTEQDIAAAKAQDKKNREYIASLQYANKPLYPIKTQNLTETELDKVIEECHFPEAIGKRNLTAEEARALVGQDPDIIAENVKSVADAFVYLKTVSLKHPGEVYSQTYHTADWSEAWTIDHHGKVGIADNDNCCCGGMANLVAFLLFGDYDEIGIIRWIGSDFHEINYFKEGNKYYVTDFVGYQQGDKWLSDGCANCTFEMDSLEDFYKYWFKKDRDYFRKVYSNATDDFGNITAMVTFECDERGSFPSRCWPESEPQGKRGIFVFPLETYGKVKVLYNKEGLSTEESIIYQKCTIDLPGWNADFSGIKYTH